MKLGKIFAHLAAIAVLAGSLFAGTAVAQDSAALESVSVPSGPALTEGEIIILLQAKVPVEVIQKFVQSRGTSFGANKEVGKRIIGAGGNVALIGTISLNQKDNGPSVASVTEDNGKRKK